MAEIRINDGVSDSTAEGLSLVRAYGVLLRNRRWLFVIPLVCAGCVFMLTVTRPRTFSTTAAFVPEGAQGGQSDLSGLASQFGVSLGNGASPGESPLFYEQLTTTSDILAAAVDSTYSVEQGGSIERVNLVRLFDENEGTAPQRRARAIRDLKRTISTSTDKETGVVRITVQTRWPSASQQIARNLVMLVNDFNLAQRRRHAAAEREFVEGRLADARGQLRSAEDELQSFLERNRQYAGDPRLAVAHERLERTIALRQQVYASLSQMYEQASLTSMRNTPLISIVQQPMLAPEPDPRGTVSKTVLGFVFGLILAVVLAFAKQFVERAEEDVPDDMREIRDLHHAITDDLRRLLPWSRRKRRAEASERETLRAIHQASD